MKRLAKIFEVSLLGSIVFITLMAIVLMLRCSPLWSQEASGWAQAIGAVAAIFASGAVATWQSRRQFEDARRLDSLTRSAGEIKMIEAIAGIVDVGNIRTYRLIRNFAWDRETVHELAENRYRYDMKAVKFVHEEYSAIALTEIPNANIIAEVIRLRSITRQLDESIDRALDNHRQINGQGFDNFFNMLDDAHRQMCIAQLSIERELARLKKMQLEHS